MTGFRWQKRIPPQGTGIWLQGSKSTYSLWMKDVSFDLDAIGLDEDQNVVELKRLTALSTVPVGFSSAVKSVVEVPAGWCLRNGIRKGFRAILASDGNGIDQLSVDEAAKTPNDAVSLDYALYTGRADGLLMYVLIDTKEARQNIARIVPRMSLHEWLTEVADAIKGVVYLKNNADDKTFSIRKSAAISGYGPMLYEIAMADIAPSYLTTDAKITPAAINLWTKFYERSDVTKVYLEKLHNGSCKEFYDFLASAANHLASTGQSPEALKLIELRIQECRQGGRGKKLQSSPDEFLKSLSQHIDLKMLPMLFAYSLTKSKEQMAVKILKNESMVIANELIKAFRISQKEFVSDLSSAASDFFNRMYRGG
jgi:uncharacterized membrane protein (UPF0127 family)